MSDWNLLSPASAPSARYNTDMAYDKFRDEIVLFGGLATSLTGEQDTWVWDGTTWTLRNPANKPPKRWGHQLSFDPFNGVVVLFGGESTLVGSGYRNDTWVWDGTDWTELFPATPPVAAGGYGMAWHDNSGLTVLFIGDIDGDGCNDFTYTFDGAEWTSESPADKPAERSGHTMASVSTGDVLLFGGICTGTTFGDTWLWDGSNWIEQSPGTSPSTRAYSRMADLGAACTDGESMFFGGSATSGGFPYSNESWLWDGADWTLLSPITIPTGRDSQTMAPYPSTNSIIMFGGLLTTPPGTKTDETWEYVCSAIPIPSDSHPFLEADFSTV